MSALMFLPLATRYDGMDPYSRPYWVGPLAELSFEKM